jgi:VWFA-related protein
VRHTIRHVPGVALAFAALAAAVITAQSGTAQPPSQAAQPPADQQPTFRTATNYVRVDVFPMKDGKPLQGLTIEDFDVLEDGVRQKIEAFEHVVITPAGPQATRREPTAQRESLQEAANPRSRVFVFFLDTPNVTVEGSHQIKEPIIRLIDRVLGPDDLAAIMTPAMSVSNMTLARKTVIIEQQLRDNWIWGTRHSITEKDRREQAYEACYPPLRGERGIESALAKALITRKRERATLEALEDLVRWLHGVREERKAIITITEGWMRYRPDPDLMKLRQSDDYQEPIPGPERIGVGRHGTLTTRDDRNIDSASLTKRECDTDRMRLAQMDNDQYFRDIVAQANRANASFYPVDPRGLAVWDSPLGPEKPPPILVDQANLRTRLESMHDLAAATDGLAVVHSNDLDAGLQRIADDLTSYYLLGYYSTNTKLDGKYRRLEVKVRRPGVDVRARRGYRAPTTEEVASAKAEAEKPAARVASAFTTAMGTLGRIRPDARFRINAAPHAAGDTATIVWVSGEFLRGPGPDSAAQGGTADIEVRAGDASATARISLKPGERAFVTPVRLAAVAEQVQVRVRFSAEGLGVPFTDAVEAAGAQPLLFRRGPATANRTVPAADFLFSRTERLRLELPVAPGTNAVSGRLLDKTGQPLQVPVAVGQRTDDPTGQLWITADVTLAPLAAGDYAIELTTSAGGETRQTIAAFRVSR